MENSFYISNRHMSLSPLQFTTSFLPLDTSTSRKKVPSLLQVEANRLLRWAIWKQELQHLQQLEVQVQGEIWELTKQTVS